MSFDASTIVSALKMDGSLPGSKRTSTTGPKIWATVPRLAVLMVGIGGLESRVVVGCLDQPTASAPPTMSRSSLVMVS